MEPANIDSSDFERKTPWIAAAALERLFASGGECRMDDPIHWPGVLFTLEQKLDEPETLDIAITSAWAHLALQIRQSLARTMQPSSESSAYGMWIRAKMIVHYGHHAGDNICDLDKLCDLCMGMEGVQSTLSLSPIPPIGEIDPDARCVAEMFEFIQSKRPFELREDVKRLLGIISEAKRTNSLFRRNIRH
ncbi:MAG: hypothetical protein ACK4UN_02015 [Limisphaerales bacterium]